MKNTATTSARKPALFTVYGFSPRSGEKILGRLWTKSDTATMWMAEVKLNNTSMYAKSTDKDALVAWVHANTTVKGIKTASARRTYNGYWDKVVARRAERHFTGQAATV
jgi:hypothetical protein